jgi:hypothetical protein
MHAKDVRAHRIAGAGLTLVLALVVGSVAAAAAAKPRPPAPGGDRTPPTAPTNLQATNIGQTSVTLTWNPSTDNSGSVTYSVVKDGQAFTVPQANGTTYTIDWLSPGRTYSFYVVATDKSL